MNGLATVVACHGLFENSAAVLNGAMIIAMLLGPIAGVSLGLVDRNDTLLRNNHRDEKWDGEMETAQTTPPKRPYSPSPPRLSESLVYGPMFAGEHAIQRGK